MKRAWKRGWQFALIAALALGSVSAAEDDQPPSAWLGVRLSGPATPEQGVAVSRVFEGSPADRAGLRARDVIVTFGGEPVTGLRDLIGTIRSQEPGAWLPLTVQRQGDEVELDVKLVERPEVIKAGGVRRGWIGVEAIELPDSLREHFGAPTDAGVMVSHVAVGSPAEAAGFRVGDVVYEVGGKPVGSLRMLRELVVGGGVGNEYDFLVARDGALLVLESPIEAAPPKER
jgi:S1-C subfamily serine protease